MLCILLFTIIPIGYYAKIKRKRNRVNFYLKREYEHEFQIYKRRHYLRAAKKGGTCIEKKIDMSSIEEDDENRTTTSDEAPSSENKRKNSMAEAVTPPYFIEESNLQKGFSSISLKLTSSKSGSESGSTMDPLSRSLCKEELKAKEGVTANE